MGLMSLSMLQKPLVVNVLGQEIYRILKNRYVTVLIFLDYGLWFIYCLAHVLGVLTNQL